MLFVFFMQDAPGTATRRGPIDPMWSQIEEDPGPPFQRKVTGRVPGSVTPSLTYEKEKIDAVGSSLSSRR